MSDTLTTWLKLVLQTVGGNRNTWGGTNNANFQLVENALAGMTSKALTGGSVTLTEDEYRKRILNLSGTLASNSTVVLPNMVAKYVVNNATTGAFTVSMKTASGSAVVIPQGGYCDVWCDGNDVVTAGLSTALRDTQLQAPSGTLAAPGLTWAADLASGFYRVGTNIYAWVIAGVARVRVEAAVFKVILGSAVEVISATDTTMNIGVPLTVQGVRPMPIGATLPWDGIRAPNGWLFKYGQAVSRTTYASLLAVLSETVTATRSNGSAVLTSVGTDLTGLGLEGSTIEGTGIPSSTTISSLTSTTITLSQAATGNGAISAIIFPHGNGDGSTTFNIPEDRGYADVGRDNMGGTSANRLTGLTNGIDGDKLATKGGLETDTLSVAKLPVHTPTVASYNLTYSKSNYSNTAVSDTPITLVNQGQASATQAVGGTITMNSIGSGEAHNNVQPSRVTNKIIFTGVFS